MGLTISKVFRRIISVEATNGGQMTELLENIGHNIRRLRDEKGWNQTELGFRADTSPSIISLIENGKRNPSTATLAKIAGALGVEVADLFPKALGRSSLEPSLNDALEEERRSSLLIGALSKTAERWQTTVSNPDASPYKVRAAVDAALDLSDALVGLVELVGKEYSTEEWAAIRLAARLLEIAKAGDERVLGVSEEEEQYEARREQIRELTHRISA